MKGWTRWILLALAVVLAWSLASPARADVMTVGVYFCGLLEQADGTTAQIPLTGSFRVTQGGLEVGVIEAGESAVSVAGSEPVVLTPMVETIDVGWELPAQVTVDMADGAHVNVPILVSPLDAGSVAAQAAASGATLTLETATPTLETEKDSGTVYVQSAAAGTATPAPTVGASASIRTQSSASASNPAQGSVQAVVTPEYRQSAVTTAAPTPAPQVGILSASADTGAFHLKVFYDSNSNGDCSVYEKGVAGVQVYLINEAGETVTGGTTGSDGEITLPGLNPGQYRVRAYLSEEWGFNRKSKETGLNKSIMDFSSEGEQDSDPIRVAAGETVERGIGLLKGVVVDGTCWLDLNSDGIMGADEPRVSGALVTLNGQKNGLSFSACSDENGYWRVTRLRAGYYDFTSYTPDGMMFTRYSKTGGKNRSVFTAEGKTKATKTLDLNDGHNDLDQNIGFAWQAAVTGIAFLDANYNGMYDEGEKPLPGVKVTAIKQNKDEEVAVTYSGENGQYTLGGLRGGTYRIRAVLPEDGSNFTVTVADPEGNHFAARENRRENFWKDYEIRDGETRTVNVGAIYYGSVSGTVYLDDDFSGTLSAGEKIAQGISVSLLDARGTVVETKQTGAKGTYTFTGLTPGQYSLRMTAKTGYAFSRRGDGNVMLNLTGGEGYSETFEVPLGENVTGLDAGMIMPGTVKGTVFADRNDNGRQDAEEGGLAGTRVRLMSEEDEEFAMTVGENGEFLFDAVMPGRYYLEYQLPADAIFARAGGDNAITGENGIGRGEWFDFRTADQKQAPLCGGLTLGRVQGRVFRDPEGSGIWQEDCAPLAGARITLTPSRTDLEAAEAVSDGEGVFELANLHPDTYRLRVTLPDGLVAARTVRVTLPLRAGENDQESSLTLAMGQTWLDQEIGAVMPASLRGRVWLDENNDGRLDPEEETPAGLTLTVTDEESGEVFGRLTTDAEGYYGFDGMVPGTYSITLPLEENMDLPPEGDNTFRKADGRLILSDIRLEEGDARDGLVLGLVKYTSLGGSVWIDRGSGAEALSGVAVRLTDADGGVLETRTTGEDGAWRFDGLLPGLYRLEAEMPEGAVAVEPDDERLLTGLISIIAETQGRLGRSAVMEVRMGKDQLNLNMGSVLPGTIGDYCWLDENGNGWQDGGEKGIPYVKVELMRNGTPVAETETDQYGLYFFREVYPAVYSLRVTAPSEVKPTQKRTDIYLIVSSLLETEGETAETETFAVASDSTNFNIDLGYVLRTPGVYPRDYGVQDTQDWSKAYEGVELK